MNKTFNLKREKGSERGKPMRKNLVLFIVLLSIIVMTSCAGKANDSKLNQKTEEIESIKENTEEQEESEIEQGQEESTSGENENESETTDFLKNNTKCFPGSEYIADVEMGVRKDSEPWPLYSIKLPVDYIFASGSMDEKGEIHTHSETEGVLSNIIKQGGLDSYLPYGASMLAQGSTDCTYSIEIFESSYVSVETEKEYYPEGTNIKEGDPHEAYVYTIDDSMAIVIRLNDDWTLGISCRGAAIEKLSPSEWGEELYSLVTPLE